MSRSNEFAPQQSTYLQNMIREVEGYIGVDSSDSGLLSKKLHDVNIKAKVIDTYLEEIELLKRLDPSSSDEQVNKIHQAFEELRRKIVS